MSYLFANIWILLGFSAFILTLKQVRLHLVHLSLFLIIVLYWASTLVAVDLEKAIFEAIKITALLPFSIMMSSLTKDQFMKLFRWFPYLGSFTAVVGIVFQMERQNRLESTLGYANALAIFLLITLLMTAFFYLKEARKGDFVLMTIQATGILLTFSRSVWVLWLISIAALFLFQEFRKRDMWLQIGTAHLLGFVVAALLKKDILFFLSRLQTIQPETSEFRMRLIYWKDSLSMIADHWWLGTGGGGWSVLQTQYQSEDYFVRFVHNHYLQLALDIGIFGPLLFIGIAVFLLYCSVVLIKSIQTATDHSTLIWIKGVLLTSAVLLLHAGFDFDFSFLFLFAVFLMFVAFIMVQSPDKATIVIQPNKFVKTILVTCIAAMIFFTSWVEIGKYYQTRGEDSVAAGDLQSAVQDYSTAQKWMPWAASVYYDKAKLYVLLGNKTGNRNEYLKGKAQVEQAIHRVPDEMLYQQLDEELSQFVVKE
ncbi:O-antigen ligase family protein [Paenibacillus plantarum]|nr:O-antigen ligase family protein [Paenibacillus plantarum]